MSFGIVRVQKFTRGSVKGIEIHDRRVKDGVSHTNKDIDWERTKENYDLHPSCNSNFSRAVNLRIGSLNLNRAVRKDAVVMAQVLVTSDKTFFDSLSREQQKQFFYDSYEMLKNRYAVENVISATVHMDEKTPHMHFNFVPVTADGRLAAKDVLTRKSLINQQDQFFSEVGKIYGLERGVAGGVKTHLEVAELKARTAREELAAIEEKSDYAGYSLSFIELKTETVGHELSEMENRVEELKKVEKELQNKLDNAKTQIMQARQSAEHEASRIVREADENASRIASEGQIKVEALIEQQGTLQGKVAASEKQVNNLQSKIQKLDVEYKGKVLTQRGLEKINPQKGMLDTIKNISLEDIEDLKKTAMKYPKTKSENESLKKQINELKNENMGLMGEIKRLEPPKESISEKLKRGDELRRQMEFKKIPPKEQDRLLSLARQDGRVDRRHSVDLDR